MCRRWMHERFFPVGFGVIESDDGEAEFSRLFHGHCDVAHLEGEMVQTLAVLVKVPVEEVVLIINDRTDHLETTLTRQIELDPLEITGMAEASTDM